MFRRAPSLLLCSLSFLILCGFDGCEGDVPIGEDDAGPIDAGASDDGGPLQCTDPNPAGCKNDDECPGSLVCAIGTRPSECTCDPINDTWGCTRDLGGGECVDPTCAGDNPEGECTGNEGCDATEVCRTGTHSSGCVCQGGDWVCTPDLSAGLCEPRTCSDPNPAGCTSNAECTGDRVCLIGTRSSQCTCDPANEIWACTGDLGGGDCVEPTGGDCGDVSCDYTTRYCEVSHPGPAGSEPVASCLELPSSCTASPSCASCGFGGSGPEDCDDTNGLRVDIYLP